MEYTFARKNFTKNDIFSMYIFFDNGDHLEIKGTEVIKASIHTYDRLVRHRKGVCHVAESGFIKLKINDKQRFVHCSKFLCDLSEFLKNRKSYIEDRCVYQSQITELWLFNSDNWHYVLLGDICARMDEEYLVLEFLHPSSMGIISDEKHTAVLPDVTKESILNIDLDFENCERFLVYHNEILEVNLSFNQELSWGASELYRTVKGGYIKIKLDKEILWRHHYFLTNRKLKTKDFERRLCGKKGERCHDICQLYVTYLEPGYGNNMQECLEIDDIKSDEEIEWLQNEEDGGDFSYYFEGGYCKKLDDGTIIITFGKNAENAVKKLSKK